METYEILQSYWWFLISVLGAALVFLLFVQGGQTMLLGARSDLQRTMMVNSLGRKWELSFTTLVVFGGAFFASFPLFYSTSFGGAYWLWMLILLGFVLQAVSYEFRKKKGNIYGTRTFDIFLCINGILGCMLLGVAVGTFFFGAEFTVQKGNLLNTAAPAISTWSPTHGLEAIFHWRNLLLGIAVLFLARMQAALYFINTIDDGANYRQQRKAVLVNGGRIRSDVIGGLVYRSSLGQAVNARYNAITLVRGQVGGYVFGSALTDSLGQNVSPLPAAGSRKSI